MCWGGEVDKETIFLRQKLGNKEVDNPTIYKEGGFKYVCIIDRFSSTLFDMKHFLSSS